MKLAVSLRALTILFCLLLLASNVQAALRLGPMFRDGAVLQRDCQLPIWGWASPGESLRIHFHGQDKTTVADDEGKWMVYLDPIASSSKPKTLTVEGKDTVEVSDVLVGDVWLCSGQSNMEWPVSMAANAQEEVSEANYPAIRHFKTVKTVAEHPQPDASGGWAICSPETAGEFSAVAYYFARHLHTELDVPIGLINSSWGGTQIESWMSREALQSDPQFHSVFENWEQRLADYPALYTAYQERLSTWMKDSRAAKETGTVFKRTKPRPPEGWHSRWLPSGLYNGMIHPFKDGAIRGVIWYQGETNAVRNSEYAALFKAMIQQWRRDFGQSELPFYFVQLANVIRHRDPTGEEFAYLREAQVQALKLPATGMAVTIDIGDDHDIHPANKQDVGKRLALNALADSYGRDVEFSGPMVKSAKEIGDEILLTFDHAAGLVLKPSDVSGFQVSDSSGEFHSCSALVREGRVVLKIPDGIQVAAVRYAWGNTPPAVLYNRFGLPASPFWWVLGAAESGSFQSPAN